MVCRSPAWILSSESLGSVSGARDEQKVKETSHLQKSCITHAPRWHPSLLCVGTNRQMIFGHSPDSVSKHRAVALPGFGNRNGSQTVGAIWWSLWVQLSPYRITIYTQPTGSGAFTVHRHSLHLRQTPSGHERGHAQTKSIHHARATILIRSCEVH